MSQYLTQDEILKYCTTVPNVQESDVIIASNLIDGYLGFSFSVNEVSETVTLNEKKRGRLQNSPVLGVETIKEVFVSPCGLSKKDGDPDSLYLDVENDGYFYYYPKATPFMLPFDFACMNIPRLKLEVKYKYGYETVPEEVKYVTAMLAQNVKQMATFAGAKRLNTLDYTVEMSNPSFFTDDMRAMLSKFRITI